MQFSEIYSVLLYLYYTVHCELIIVGNKNVSK